MKSNSKYYNYNFLNFTHLFSFLISYLPNESKRTKRTNSYILKKTFFLYLRIYKK